MKSTITLDNFLDAFKAIRPDNFSYEGLCALFHYFEEMEELIGQEIELDVIAICCEYSEYPNLASIEERYEDINSMEDLTSNTTVIEHNDGIIIREF